MWWDRTHSHQPTIIRLCTYSRRCLSLEVFLKLKSNLGWSPVDDLALHGKRLVSSFHQQFCEYTWIKAKANTCVTDQTNDCFLPWPIASFLSSCAGVARLVAGPLKEGDVFDWGHNEVKLKLITDYCNDYCNITKPGMQLIAEIHVIIHVIIPEWRGKSMRGRCSINILQHRIPFPLGFPLWSALSLLPPIFLEGEGRRQWDKGSGWDRDSLLQEFWEKC